jgi:hypothetical protein
LLPLRIAFAPEQGPEPSILGLQGIGPLLLPLGFLLLPLGYLPGPLDALFLLLGLACLRVRTPFLPIGATFLLIGSFPLALASPGQFLLGRDRLVRPGVDEPEHLILGDQAEASARLSRLPPGAKGRGV